MGVVGVLSRALAAGVVVVLAVVSGGPQHSAAADSPTEGGRAAGASGGIAFLEGLVGPDRRPLVPPWAPGAMWPTFSPDGTRLAWTQTRYSEEQRRYVGRVVVSAASGEQRDALPNDDRVVSNVSWSPDGSRLAVVTTDGDTDTLWLLDAAGTAEPTVALTQPRTYYSRIPHVSWSPTGRHLALVRGQFLSHDVFLLDVGTGALRQVTRDCDWQPFGTSARSDCGGEPYSRSGSGWVGFTRTFTLDLRTGHSDRVGADESGFVTSWQPCPGGACTAFGSPRHPTTMAVAAEPRRDRVRVTVSVMPVLANTDETVDVILSARRGGRWVEVAERRRTTYAGSFQHGFARPGRTDRCRVDAAFAGNAHRRPASASVRIDC